MKTINITPVFIFCLLTLSTGCTKKFLEEKPSSTIVQPQTLSELSALMENAVVLTGISSALPQLASDEYNYADQQSWQGALSITERNSYVWQSDLFGGDIGINDWNKPYAAVFYANNVLKALNDLDSKSAPQQYNNLQGWALFARAYALYDLAKNFAPAYDAATAGQDLGIPLKRSPNIDELAERSTLQQTYDYIINDLKTAATLLNENNFLTNKNRASNVAALAMLARVYLSMRDYENAGRYANECLKRHDKLIDYRTVSKTAATPFSYVADEIIYFSTQISDYAGSTAYNSRPAIKIDPILYGLYNEADLRLPIFFTKNTLGNYNMKRGYTAGTYPFTGLATDEIYLISAECYARAGKLDEATALLNKLLVFRFPSDKYVPITVTNKDDILNKVLLERRKELIWRGLRWMDLKRLNKEGRNITLTRTINGTIYTLPPNDPRYTFPIPDDEINLSGIKQNIR